MRSEYQLLTDALNNIKIDLGFDCDEDGIPDTIGIFSAKKQVVVVWYLRTRDVEKRSLDVDDEK